MITIEIKIGEVTTDNKMIVEGDLSIKKSMEIIMILKKYSDELLEQGIKSDAKKYIMRREKPKLYEIVMKGFAFEEAVKKAQENADE